MTGCFTESKDTIDLIKQELASNDKFKDVELISGFDICAEAPNMSDAYYLGRDVETILGCDAVMFIGNSDGKSHGCQVEKAVVDAYNINRYVYDGSLSVVNNFLQIFK